VKVVVTVPDPLAVPVATVPTQFWYIANPLFASDGMVNVTLTDTAPGMGVTVKLPTDTLSGLVVKVAHAPWEGKFV
jgi:hypothetical protein